MLINQNRQTVLARCPETAATFRRRLFGMIFRRFANCGFDALIFPGCSAIHTCWMLEKIDVIFLDRQGRAVRLYPELPPWRVAFGGRGAASTVELPAGAISRSGTQAGDKLEGTSK